MCKHIGVSLVELQGYDIDIYMSILDNLIEAGEMQKDQPNS